MIYLAAVASHACYWLQRRSWTFRSAALRGFLPPTHSADFEAGARFAFELLLTESFRESIQGAHVMLAFDPMI